MKKITFIKIALLIILLSGCAIYQNQQYAEYERQLQIAHQQGQISDLEYSQRMYELNKDRQADFERRRQASLAIGNSFQTQQYQQQRLAMQEQQVNMQKWAGYVPAPLAAAGYVPTGSDD